MTAGPWRPIRLETYTYRIEDIRIDADLIGPEFNTATLTAKVELAASGPKEGLSYKAILKTAKGQKVKEGIFELKDTLDWTFDQGEVEAWWPIHYGKQPLYQLEVVLCDKVSHFEYAPTGLTR
jgi:beta-mannosidase